MINNDISCILFQSLMKKKVSKSCFFGQNDDLTQASTVMYQVLRENVNGKVCIHLINVLLQAQKEVRNL